MRLAANTEGSQREGGVYPGEAAEEARLGPARRHGEAGQWGRTGSGFLETP